MHAGHENIDHCALQFPWAFVQGFVGWKLRFIGQSQSNFARRGDISQCRVTYQPKSSQPSARMQRYSCNSLKALFSILCMQDTRLITLTGVFPPRIRFSSPRLSSRNARARKRRGRSDLPSSRRKRRFVQLSYQRLVTLEDFHDANHHSCD